MSLIRASALRDFQEDLRWPLLDDEFFTDLGVIDWRMAELETEVARLLTVVTEKNSKCGAGVIVMPLKATDDLPDASAAHPLLCTITFLVLEVPEINRGDSGTKKSALEIAERIRQVMKHRILGGFATPLAPADPIIEAVEDPIAPVALEVRFLSRVGVDQAMYKVANPVFDYDTVTGILTITCGTPDPSIYYTLDGSFPSPLNSSALLYTVPVQMEGEWFIRVAARAGGYLASNVNALRSTDISSEMGDGASIGGLN
jgi:hypothetical protein